MPPTDPAPLSGAGPLPGRAAAAGGGFFDLAARRLAWFDSRQTVLSQNIANASVPGYHPRDVRPFSPGGDRFRHVLARTDPRHLPAPHDAGAGTVEARGPHDASGNGVEIDTELTKLAETGTDQTLVTNLMTTYLGLYRTALGR